MIPLLGHTVDDSIWDPGLDAALLYIAILNQKFGLLTGAVPGNSNLFNKKVLSYTYPHIGVGLFQFLDVVPLRGIIDRVQNRQQAPLLAIA